MSSNAPSGSSEVTDARFWKRAWSVQSIIALLCLVCILLTASATEVMNTVTCDSALEDTRDTMDESTTAIDKKAQESLTRVSSEMMIYITNGVTMLIDNHMKEAVNDANRAINLMNGPEFATMPKNNSAFNDALVQPLYDQVLNIKEGGSVIGLGVSAGEYGVTIISRHFEYSAGAPTTNITMMTVSTPEAAYLRPVLDKWITDEYPPFRMADGAGAEILALPRSGLMQIGQGVFPLVVSFGQFAGYVYTAVLADPSGSAAQVEVLVSMGCNEIRNFLTSVTDSAAKINEQAILRAFTVVASTWLDESLKKFMPGYDGSANQIGYLTGTSHGNVTAHSLGKDPITGLDGLDVYSPNKAEDSNDPYIKAIAIAIGGDYARFQTNASVLTVLIDDVPEQHIVSSERLTFELSHLDWWITVSIDGESILGDVQRETAKVNADIVEDKQDVADEVEEKKMLQRVIIVVIGVVLVIISAATSWALLRPVKALQRSMELVANMELDEIEISKSTFYELRLMQRDFRKMIENLVEFRAYVPSSVLLRNGYSAEGGTAEPPTGIVAIVFTDIRGSTALWKAGAADMNDAMEIHNEVMRDACVAHKGYEVKTIGDAFMVSFSSAVAAANFALDVQTNLKSKEWPIGLNLPESGMVVRIGINYGATIAEENPVTGRVDYRGSTVNLASRVEAKALPGTVCITSDMYAALKGNLDKVGNPTIQAGGTHDIKGLGAGHELFTMVPSALNNRLNTSQSDTEPRRKLEHIDTSKSHDGMSITSAHKKGVAAKRTALQVQRTTVTVAVCRLNTEEGSMFDNCNIMVRAALEAAQSTDGVIGNVTGCTLTVVWNASKRCLMHTTAALTFVSEMKKLQGIIQVGLATGTMMHGNVGTRTSRFATAFGAPLEAAEAMTDHAHRLGVYCLMADCTSDKRLQADQTLRSCLRLVDAWCEEGRIEIISIFEVNLASLEKCLESWSLVGVPMHKSGAESSSIEYQSNVVQHALTSGDGVAKLREIVQEFPDDHVLRKSFELIAEARPTEGYRCRVSFSHYTEL